MLKIIKNINNYLNENIKFLLWIFLIILSIHFILYKNKTREREREREKDKENIKEGFDIARGFSDMRDALNSVGEFAKKIPGEISNIGTKLEGVGKIVENGVVKTATEVKTGVESGVKEVKSTATRVTSEIDTKLKKFLNEVEDVTKNVVIAKILSFFDQLKNILDKAIVNPFKTLFIGIGNVFTEIFGILKMIGDKIVNLPGCMISYIIDSTINAISSVLRSFLPAFIIKILSFIYNYTIKLILNLTGYTTSIEQCKSFNINEKVNKINDKFKNISNTFKSDFGNIPPLKL